MACVIIGCHHLLMPPGVPGVFGGCVHPPALSLLSRPSLCSSASGSEPAQSAMPCFSVPCGCGLLLDATPGSQLHQSHVLHCHLQSSPTLRKACACAKRDSACRFSGIPLLPGPSRTSSLSSTDFATGAEEPLTSARWDLLKPRLSPSGTHNPMPSIASRCQPRTSPIMGNQVTGASLGK